MPQPLVGHSVLPKGTAEGRFTYHANSPACSLVTSGAEVSSARLREDDRRLQIATCLNFVRFCPTWLCFLHMTFSFPLKLYLFQDMQC